MTEPSIVCSNHKTNSKPFTPFPKPDWESRHWWGDFTTEEKFFQWKNRHSEERRKFFCRERWVIILQIFLPWFIMQAYELRKTEQRYHKSKNPRGICLGQTLGGCANLQRILGSIVVLEKGFEPIVYKTSENARNDFLYEHLEWTKQRDHPLDPKK